MPDSSSENSNSVFPNYRWKKRVFLVSAPKSEHAKLSEQRRLFEVEKPGADERDLLWLELGDTSQDQAIRDKFNIRRDVFVVLLIGKDGSEKERSSKPLKLLKWFAVIDTMPMRRDEIRHR